MIPIRIMSDLRLCIPEIIIAIGTMMLLLIGVFSRKRTAIHLIILPIILLSISFISLFFMRYGIGFNGAYILDSFSYFAKVVILFASILIFIMMSNCIHTPPFSSFEFPVIILLSILGMLLMVSANDMISFYMALELLSLALYVIIAMNRESMLSIESALKYFVLGSISSCILLYGMSFIYGLTGFMDFPHIAASLFVGKKSFVLVVGIVFILVGLFFKIALVPFHMWIPDVYEGSSLFITAFLATVPKFAVTMALLRMINGFWPMMSDFWSILILVSLLSIVLGAVAAIRQKNLKRLMAYSSISHAGYAILGIATGTSFGIVAMIRYILIYLIMVLGFFACILSLRRKDGKNIKNISDLAGLSQQSPFLACILTILTFSLAGIPPFAGFFGKYFIFLATIKRDLYFCAILGILFSVISAYYYLYIISVVWFDKEIKGFIVARREISLVCFTAGLFAVTYFLFENILSIWINTAISSFSLF